MRKTGFTPFITTLITTNMEPIKDVNFVDDSLEVFMSAYEERRDELKEIYQRMVRNLLVEYAKSGTKPSPDVMEKVKEFLV